jgi:subtilase family serine protease
MMLFKTLPFVAASSLMSIATLTLPAAVAQRIDNNVPEGIRQASDLGRVASTQEINITVHLEPQNKAVFDKAVDALYNPASPTFHRWFTEADLKKYAPAKEQSDARVQMINLLP